MNPNGIVVNENTNGIITVNGHSYEGNRKRLIIQTLPFLLQSISQSRSKTATDMVKASQDFPICLAVVLSYSVLVILYVEEEVQRNVSKKDW